MLLHRSKRLVSVSLHPLSDRRVEPLPRPHDVDDAPLDTLDNNTHLYHRGHYSRCRYQADATTSFQSSIAYKQKCLPLNQYVVFIAFMIMTEGLEFYGREAYYATGRVGGPNNSPLDGCCFIIFVYQRKGKALKKQTK